MSGQKSMVCSGGNRNSFQQLSVDNHRTSGPYRHRIRNLKRPLGRFFLLGIYLYSEEFSRSQELVYERIRAR